MNVGPEALNELAMVTEWLRRERQELRVREVMLSRSIDANALIYQLRNDLDKNLRLATSTKRTTDTFLD
ncbi:MAG TPA: hypothetical protein VEF35_09795 [Candidatus Bathyarchaeia archaeon]|nr:hypothetical protein [Candidatus Bathyarchaeia archaeon]